MKRVLSAVGVALLVLAIGYKISQDPEIQKRLVPAAQAPQVQRLVPPTSVDQWAGAFCAANAEYLAANTTLEVTAEQIAAYFLEGPPCVGYRYLGQINDGGVYRYAFVFTFDMREDWVIVTWDGELDVMETFNRG